jgi:hypothetical protein
MTGQLLAPLAFALLCAGSLQASAALMRTHGDRVGRPAPLAHQRIAAMPAAAPERPTVFPSAWPRSYPYNFHETDGLSRNPNDCAVWGCIDSN